MLLYILRCGPVICATSSLGAVRCRHENQEILRCGAGAVLYYNTGLKHQDSLSAVRRSSQISISIITPMVHVFAMKNITATVWLGAVHGETFLSTAHFHSP